MSVVCLKFASTWNVLPEQYHAVLKIRTEMYCIYLFVYFLFLNFSYESTEFLIYWIFNFHFQCLSYSTLPIAYIISSSCSLNARKQCGIPRSSEDALSPSNSKENGASIKRSLKPKVMKDAIFMI